MTRWYSSADDLLLGSVSRSGSESRALLRGSDHARVRRAPRCTKMDPRTRGRGGLHLPHRDDLDQEARLCPGLARASARFGHYEGAARYHVAFRIGELSYLDAGLQLVWALDPDAAEAVCVRHCCLDVHHLDVDGDVTGVAFVSSWSTPGGADELPVEQRSIEALQTAAVPAFDREPQDRVLPLGRLPRGCDALCTLGRRVRGRRPYSGRSRPARKRCRSSEASWPRRMVAPFTYPRRWAGICQLRYTPGPFT